MALDMSDYSCLSDIKIEMVKTNLLLKDILNELERMNKSQR
jgi:hypothetical protein